MSAIFRVINEPTSVLGGIVERALGKAINSYRDLPDMCISTVGFSGYKSRYFINNLTRTIPSPRYLQAGLWKGSMFCSAIGGVLGITAVGIDNFSYQPDRAELDMNIRMVKYSSSTVEILERDFNGASLDSRGPFNIFLYDGGRGVDPATILPTVINSMDSSFVFIVQDWDHAYGGGDSPLNAGVLSSITALGLTTQYYTDLQTGGFYESGGNNASDVYYTDWHNGLGIFVLSK
jgi:hypothetical protein